MRNLKIFEIQIVRLVGRKQAAIKMAKNPVNPRKFWTSSAKSLLRWYITVQDCSSYWCVSLNEVCIDPVEFFSSKKSWWIVQELSWLLQECHQTSFSVDEINKIHWLACNAISCLGLAHQLLTSYFPSKMSAFAKTWLPERLTIRHKTKRYILIVRLRPGS